jgi:DNA polymerase I-like protein with 3'-5' exonuclease and polymerase domains
VTEYLLRGQRVTKGDLTLQTLSKEYLSIEKIDKVKTYWDAGYETTEIPLNVLLPYQKQDCFNALAIYQRQVAKVKEAGMSVLAFIQNENTKVWSDIEFNGMKMDVQEAKAQIKAQSLALATIDTELKMMVDDIEINLSSKQHLSAFLFGGVVKTDGEEWRVKTFNSHSTYKPYKTTIETWIDGMGFTPGAKVKTKGDHKYYRTNKDTIKYLTASTKKQRHVKKLLVERSKVAKALETLQGKEDDTDKGLINKLQAGDLIHGTYNQTVTKHGRPSCSNPNLQNQPRKGTSPLRQVFIPRFDYILGVDMSAAEWRAAAFLSQDPVMLQEIADGKDPHAENAKFVFGVSEDDPKFSEMRQLAKVFTFRLLYGGGAYGFYMDANFPKWSKKKWEAVVEKFYEKYAVLKNFQDTCINLVWKNHGVLYNPTGRKFIFHKALKGYKPTQIKNFPIQSLATGDIMPLAMILIYREFKKRGFKSLIIGQVHDNLLFDALKDELEEIGQMCIGIFEKLPYYIEKMWGFKFNVPLTGDCEIGDNYGQMEKYKLAA